VDENAGLGGLRRADAVPIGLCRWQYRLALDPFRKVGKGSIEDAELEVHGRLCWVNASDDDAIPASVNHLRAYPKVGFTALQQRRSEPDQAVKDNGSRHAGFVRRALAITLAPYMLV
jgi:hypothetical protein